MVSAFEGCLLGYLRHPQSEVRTPPFRVERQNSIRIRHTMPRHSPSALARGLVNKLGYTPSQMTMLVPS